MKHRVYVDDRILQWLHNKHDKKIIKEEGIKPTDSQMVVYALINYVCLLDQQEAEFNLMKNGAWKYKIKQKK